MTDDTTDPQALTPLEVVCPECHLVRNRFTDGCGNCPVGRSVHDREGT